MIEQVAIDQLKPHPKNPNKHSPEQIARLAELIQYQGWRLPIIVSKQSGFIVSGHGRLEAAKYLKMRKVPVSYQDFRDDEQEYAFLVSDNAIASWAELDLASINQYVVELGPDFKVDLLGIKDFTIEIADKLEPQCDEDEVPENVDPITKLGDLYILGSHRLLCGDSTSIDAVEKLMGVEKADMVFTDPPYNVNYKGSDGQKIQNDNMDEESFSKFCNDFYVNYYLSMKEGAAIYVFHSDRMGDHFLSQFKKAGFKLSSTLVWNKTSLIMGGSDYHWKHELCLYGWKPGASHHWYSDRKQTTVFDHDKGSGQDNKMHPTCKPISLVEYFMTNSSKANDTVLDLFGGSGSTMIASEKHNRNCFMMELDPHYCDVIVERWQAYTGKKAKRIQDGG